MQFNLQVVLVTVMTAMSFVQVIAIPTPTNAGNHTSMLLATAPLLNQFVNLEDNTTSIYIIDYVRSLQNSS
ncbi:hypothetical protein K435DRAFT_879186 [Dendrothele bispora CBS 962.96]|uniref:Uncharacterized protein n=1 Tax=Dendrothele bispora (strain CBS 962.96) TaxID=1314807 RepID=A0A4S8KLP4_DENBC|nr:hypothetical protein K435DRAFT_879186 [Dendrothele bispora CBS 962.96]